ncbi:zinc finger protein 37-like isoform X2 [Ischnura elegans]|uniref:zinc finger protein 37-like isoform X2 n=1 Tax=Ischnura elegans TaxID=197161 RepID=UPI001ED8B4EC|nr:zinc finger protein 37-like isoform X2 [Ischnura elegans]
MVSKDDGLPETICGSCVDKVIDFESFKQECIKSAVMLRNIVDGKGAMGTQSKCGTIGGIQIVDYESMEKIDAEEPFYNNDLDPLPAMNDIKVKYFEWESVGRENGSDLTVISSRNLVGNQSMDGQTAGETPSLSFKEHLIECAVLERKDDDLGHVSDTNHVGGTLLKVECECNFVRLGVTGEDDALMESLEDSDPEQLRTIDINTVKEEPSEEDSDTKPDLSKLFDEDLNFNCPSSPLPTTDNIYLDYSMRKEENVDEVEAKSSCRDSEFFHKPNAVSQQLQLKMDQVSVAHSFPSCSSSLLTESSSSRGKLSQHASNSSDHHKVQENEFPKHGNDSVENNELPVVGLVSSCARLLPVSLILKTCSKTKKFSRDSSTSSSQSTYPDLKDIHPSQSDSTSNPDIEAENTSGRVSPVRETRANLPRATKKQRSSNNESSLSTMALPKSEVDIYKCFHCRKEYRNKYFLAKHIMIIHQKTKQKSDQGKDKFIVAKQADGLYPCAECDRMFRRKQTLQYHVNVVHKGLKKQFKCSLCGTYVSRKDELKRHFERKHKHLGDCVPFPCQDCSSVFSSKKNLRDHKRRVHDFNGHMECTVCKKIFNLAYNLNRHMATHQQHREFACEACGKTFKEERCMKMHQRRKHEVKKSHQCGHCNKLFVTKYEVQTHVKVHFIEQLKQERSRRKAS